MDSEPVRRDDILVDEASGTKAAADHEELLRDIRDDFSYFRDFWRENHAEAKIDLRFVSGDPWDIDARREREDNNRPVLSPDELDQYLNAAVNNLRQNKRAIKVNAKGDGANDQDAERRSAIIRGIEYQSNAQSAYANAFECAINCGIGFFGVTTKKSGKNGEVVPGIRTIENPLSVLLDPNAKLADFSDQKRCFVFDVIRKRDFEQKFPKALKRSFTADDMAVASEWFQAENIVIAEYWRIDGYDEDGDDGKVTQYITNGVEILEENEWPGSWIPIIPVTGKKVYVPMGSEMKRMYYSMIRKARGPQMMLAYIASQEAEEYGMAPRAPLIGYVGQFETDKEAWDTLNKVPRAYIQADPVVDQSNGNILPLPTRMPFSPNASAYEIGFERWRRSVQSSMGITPLPTAAQRSNEKSGVALDRIATQQAIGSYHFTDNFDRSLEYAGRQIDELITIVLDTPRQVAMRNPDDSHQLIHIVPKGQPMPADVKPEEVFDPTSGEGDVTISTGMSYDSQRQEASAFVDLLVGNLGNLPVPPQQKAELLAQAIKLKNIGPIGDEIAKIIDPTPPEGEEIPPQAKQAMGQMQQQNQALNAACQHYEQQIKQLEFEKQAKVVDNQARVQIEQMKIEADIAKAEINTKSQIIAEREAFVHDIATKIHVMNLETIQQAQQQQAAQQAQPQPEAQPMPQEAPQPQGQPVNQANTPESS